MMEDSLGSSANKSVATKGTSDVAEESGWTAYFEDFLSNQREEHSLPSASYGSPSLVSDAASSAAWKINNNNQLPAMPRKLSFKKTRTKEISSDDSLEDTASSPVNSPKVSTLKQMDTNPRKRDDHNVESFVGKGGGTNFCSEIKPDERNEMNFDGKINDECTQLKKRGLCLVPLSMLVNYLG